MPENVAREELETLNIRVQGVTQIRSVCRDKDPTKDRPPSLALKYLKFGGFRCRQCVDSPSYAFCE